MRRSFTFVPAREVAYSKQSAFFFFDEAAESDQSFEFYLTEDQSDWLLDFLFLPCELNSQFSVKFLGIPRNSQKFPIMQINSDLKSLELLGISGKGRLQFCEDLESLGIPRNSQLYKLPII